jgi:hypothetical protein
MTTERAEQCCQMVYFQTKARFGSFLEGLRLENVNIFYCHLEYFTDILDIVCPFCTFCVHFIHFSGFDIMHQEKSGNPGAEGNF